MTARPWTDADHAQLDELIAAGLTMTKIAASTNRTFGQVKGKVQRRGLRMQSKGGVTVCPASDAALRKRWAAIIPDMKARLRAEIEALP